MRIETELLEFCGDPFGVLFVIGRADVVRARRETLQVSAEIVRAGDGAEFLFPLALRPRRFGRVAEQRLLVGSDMVAERRERETGKRKDREKSVAVHAFPLKWSPYFA